MNNTSLFILKMLILLVAALAVTIHPSAAEDLKGQVAYTEGAYRVGVGDILSVNVYNQLDLSHDKILVRPDGNATFNGVGEVLVAGKTLHEITWLLESHLGDLVRNPKVSVNVVESRPGSVYLAGAVMKPGMFQLNEMQSADASKSSSQPKIDFRLSNILAHAGGVKLNADLSSVQIRRNDVAIRTINLWNMLREGASDEDFLLQNGDSIFIPSLSEMALDDKTYNLLLSSSIGPKTFPVRVIGEVKEPTVVELTGTSPYLNSAIAKSGGFKDGANRKVVAVRRFTAENKFTTLHINPNSNDFMLRPNDVVFVSELKVFKAGRFGQAAGNALSPFTNAASVIFGAALLGLQKTGSN